MGLEKSCLWKGMDKMGWELGMRLITAVRPGRGLPAVTYSDCGLLGESLTP